MKKPKYSFNSLPNTFATSHCNHGNKGDTSEKEIMVNQGLIESSITYNCIICIRLHQPSYLLRSYNGAHSKI